jgi:hypothetical protein
MWFYSFGVFYIILTVEGQLNTEEVNPIPDFGSETLKQDHHVKDKDKDFSETELFELFPDLKELELLLENLLPDKEGFETSEILEDYSDEEDSTQKIELIEESVKQAGETFMDN